MPSSLSPPFASSPSRLRSFGGLIFPHPHLVFSRADSPSRSLCAVLYSPSLASSSIAPMPYVGEDTILRFQDAFGRDDQSLRRVYASSLRSLYPHLFFTYEPRPHNIFVTESGQVFTSPSSTYLPPIPRRLSDENIPTVQGLGVRVRVREALDDERSESESD
ncbi:hypothetical protein GLOTRDRAFT_133489 [Gloeophyllum trabeum ATCC 11539]|uniref:Uncharacterized protein n=1 Tax=Gloeophyllum trabeum (strain ATCC 11539 / FP-39264 / Madison 617) TaxID=670483 RepID=S7PV04_GLOTA|nr:uncharacterized protein GLOTRDRAFT_133489 [Gloeophyllum trabeum ATCC 11539]EPQ51172.1 hypothetical protein GLOTRDRAFT_133489 [Gloeophyllum trabeum ATCC 11539]